MKALDWHNIIQLFIDFSRAQSQLTPLLMVGFGRNSNSLIHKLLCISLVHARMKVVELKMEAIKWSQQY